MEDRKRTIIAILIGLVVVVALLSSFGLSLFSRTPRVEVADPDAVGSQEPGATAAGDAAGITVEVTPATVQSVIASMSRYESYSRTLTVTHTWGDEKSGTITAQVWTDGGWTRADVTLASGVVEHSIMGEGQLWLWYEDGTEETADQVYVGPAAELSSDLLQRLPTYEDVLALDAAGITDAGYVEYNGQPCIYVEAEQQTLGYLYRYWISETNGLLMAAETEKSGVLVYRMESNEVISPMSGGAEVFALPDGTILKYHLDQTEA